MAKHVESTVEYGVFYSDGELIGGFDGAFEAYQYSYEEERINGELGTVVFREKGTVFHDWEVH